MATASAIIGGITVLVDTAPYSPHALRACPPVPAPRRRPAIQHVRDLPALLEAEPRDQSHRDSDGCPDRDTHTPAAAGTITSRACSGLSIDGSPSRWPLPVTHHERRTSLTASAGRPACQTMSASAMLTLTRRRSPVAAVADSYGGPARGAQVSAWRGAATASAYRLRSAIKVDPARDAILGDAAVATWSTSAGSRRSVPVTVAVTGRPAARAVPPGCPAGQGRCRRRLPRCAAR